MPRINHEIVYAYDELSDRAKERARDWYREASAGDGFWHESITCRGGDFETIAGFLGWTIGTARGTRAQPAIYFSGFSSQGDGATFDGAWSASDVEAGALKEHAPQDAELARLADEFAAIASEYPGATAGVQTRRYHRLDTDVYLPERDDTDDDKDAAAIEALKEATSDLAHWLYRTLEREYEYVNSDEVVAESIEANEYEFDESGRIA